MPLPARLPALLTVLVVVGLPSGLAAAAEPAWYSPDAVAQASTLFGRVAQRTGPAFETTQDDLRVVSRALEDLETSTYMVQDIAPSGFLDWSTGNRRWINGQFLVLQRDIDGIQDRYVEAFSSAVDRAVAVEVRARPVSECKMSKVEAMMGKKGCEGKDISAALAKRIDQDTVLDKAIADINAQPWPRVSPKVEQWAPAPLTGAGHTVDFGALTRALWKDRVKVHRAALNQALEEGKAEDAPAARAAYEAALLKEGQALREALVPALGRYAKDGGPADVALCPNPPAFGGCSGEDITKPLLERLAADKKFQKALD